MDASLRTLELMAEEIGATVIILKEIILAGSGQIHGSSDFATAFSPPVAPSSPAVHSKFKADKQSALRRSGHSMRSGPGREKMVIFDPDDMAAAELDLSSDEDREGGDEVGDVSNAKSSLDEHPGAAEVGMFGRSSNGSSSYTASFTSNHSNAGDDVYSRSRSISISSSSTSWSGRDLSLADDCLIDKTNKGRDIQGVETKDNLTKDAGGGLAADEHRMARPVPRGNKARRKEERVRKRYLDLLRGDGKGPIWVPPGSVWGSGHRDMDGIAGRGGTDDAVNMDSDDTARSDYDGDVEPDTNDPIFDEMSSEPLDTLSLSFADIKIIPTDLAVRDTQIRHDKSYISAASALSSRTGRSLSTSTSSSSSSSTFFVASSPRPPSLTYCDQSSAMIPNHSTYDSSSPPAKLSKTTAATKLESSHGAHCPVHTTVQSSDLICIEALIVKKSIHVHGSTPYSFSPLRHSTPKAEMEREIEDGVESEERTVGRNDALETDEESDGSAADGWGLGSDWEDWDGG